MNRSLKMLHAFWALRAPGIDEYNDRVLGLPRNKQRQFRRRPQRPNRGFAKYTKPF